MLEKEKKRASVPPTASAATMGVLRRMVLKAERMTGETSVYKKRTNKDKE